MSPAAAAAAATTLFLFNQLTVLVTVG